MPLLITLSIISLFYCWYSTSNLFLRHSCVWPFLMHIKGGRWYILCFLCFIFLFNLLNKRDFRFETMSEWMKHKTLTQSDLWYNLSNPSYALKNSNWFSISLGWTDSGISGSSIDSGISVSFSKFCKMSLVLGAHKNDSTSYLNVDNASSMFICYIYIYIYIYILNNTN